MSHIPKRDPELPGDPPSETPDAQHREKCFEGLMICLVDVVDLIRKVPINTFHEVGESDEAEERARDLTRMIIKWRDGP